LQAVLQAWHPMQRVWSMTFAHLTDWDEAGADIRGILYSNHWGRESKKNAKAPRGTQGRKDGSGPLRRCVLLRSLELMRLSRALLFLLAVAGVVQLARYYPQLPQTMASHFDGAGRPDGFQSRDAFVALCAAILLGTVAMFGGLGTLFRRLPSTWFNLPNRDYWLAPERREETLEAISTQLEWFGAVSLLLYLFVIQMVMETNLTSEPRLDSRLMWAVVGLYLIFALVWTTRFILRFRKP
jgi:hypothetical protein